MTLGSLMADLRLFEGQDFNVSLALVKEGNMIGFTLQGPHGEFLLTKAWVLSRELQKAVSEAPIAC